jgi:hypothetical protein
VCSVCNIRTRRWAECLCVEHGVIHYSNGGAGRAGSQGDGNGVDIAKNTSPESRG